MPRPSCIPLGVLLVLCAALACHASDPAPPNTLSAEDKAAGWTLLFDGKTFDGWDDPARKSPPADAWTIEDGCLKAVAHPRITEDLFTRDHYRDFELVLEWRISPAGNSGLKYRIQSHQFIPPKPPGAGPEKFEQSVERSEEHTSELQSRQYLVCRLLLD